MKRNTFFAMIGGVILCLALVFTYSGVGSGEAGASGTSMFSCGKSSIGPEVVTSSSSSVRPAATEHSVATVQLLVADVNYSETWGSDRWRTTFEVRVMLPSGENIREASDIDFFHMRKRSKPLIYEEGWISINDDAQYTDHGLLSFEGEWRDRKNPEVSGDPIWFLAHIVNPDYAIDDWLIWEGDFSESLERPKEVWDRASHLRYEPESERVLVSQSTDYQQVN